VQRHSSSLALAPGPTGIPNPSLPPALVFRVEYVTLQEANWLSRRESCIPTHCSCTIGGDLWQTARSAYALRRHSRILRNVRHGPTRFWLRTTSISDPIEACGIFLVVFLYVVAYTSLAANECSLFRPGEGKWQPPVYDRLWALVWAIFPRRYTGWWERKDHRTSDGSCVGTKTLWI